MRHEYGGAPLLGLKGLVVKTHGSAKAEEVEHSVIPVRYSSNSRGSVRRLRWQYIKTKNQSKERFIVMEFEKLQSIIAEVLNVDADEITPETTFVDDLGADSLDVFPDHHGN